MKGTWTAKPSGSTSIRHRLTRNLWVYNRCRCDAFAIWANAMKMPRIKYGHYKHHTIYQLTLIITVKWSQIGTPLVSSCWWADYRYLSMENTLQWLHGTFKFQTWLFSLAHWHIFNTKCCVLFREMTKIATMLLPNIRCCSGVDGR